MTSIAQLTIDGPRKANALGSAAPHLSAGAGGKPFVTIDDVVMALAPDRRLNIGGVARSYGRLGHRKAGTRF